MPQTHMQASIAPAFVNLDNCMKHWSFGNFTPGKRAVCMIRQENVWANSQSEEKKKTLSTTVNWQSITEMFNP